MCELIIDRVDSDTLQQATTLTAYVSGKCDHGGDLYMRVLWDGRLGPESAVVQAEKEFSHTPVHFTAHNLSDRIEGVRVVLRCKATSVYQETEV